MSVYNQGFHVTVKILHLTSDKAPVSPESPEKKINPVYIKTRQESMRIRVM